MKKILIIASLLTLPLSGCFGGDEKADEKKVEGFHKYETEEFQIQVPDEWETLTTLNLPSGIDQNTVVAFRSNIKDPKFTANIAVIKNDIPEEVSTLDYSKALKDLTQKLLLNAKELNVESYKIFIGGTETDSFFIHHEGREHAEADLKRYMQVAGVKNKQAYTVLGAYLADSGEDLVKKVETAVRSFLIQ